MESIGYVPKLEVSYLFRKSWEIFTSNLVLVVGIFLVYILLAGATSSLVGRSTAMGTFFQILEFVIQGPLLAGVCWVLLRLVRGEPTEIREMFEGFQEFGRAFGVYVFYTILLGVGLLLLVVPGLLVAVGLMPAMYLVLDTDRDVIATLKQAWAMTGGYRGQIFLVFLALLGINLLGVLMLLVGVVFTAAFSLLVGAALYNELARKAASQ